MLFPPKTRHFFPPPDGALTLCGVSAPTGGGLFAARPQDVGRADGGISRALACSLALHGLVLAAALQFSLHHAAPSAPARPEPAIQVQFAALPAPVAVSAPVAAPAPAPVAPPPPVAVPETAPELAEAIAEPAPTPVAELPPPPLSVQEAAVEDVVPPPPPVPQPAAPPRPLTKPKPPLAVAARPVPPPMARPALPPVPLPPVATKPVEAAAAEAARAEVAPAAAPPVETTPVETTPAVAPKMAATPVAAAPVAAIQAPAAPPAIQPDANDEPPVLHQARFRAPPRPPVYPSRSRALEQEGVSVIRALIDADGASREVKLWRSSGYQMLDQAALAAVRGWAFEAARLGGRPVLAWVEIPVRFELR